MVDDEILQGNKNYKVCQILQFRLFVYKQKILNSESGDSYQLKPHIVSHMFPDWYRFASRRIDDVNVVEAAHKPVKGFYKGSSRRLSTIASEIYQKFQNKRVLRRAYDIICVDAEVESPIKTANPRAVCYHSTEDPNITFSCSGYAKDFQELKYTYATDKLSLIQDRDHLKFLSGHVNLEDIRLNILAQPELDDFWENYTLNREGF